MKIVANLRVGWQAGEPKFGLYVMGALGLTGSLVGRMPCGWLCPFGLLQELLYKLPGPKFGVPRSFTFIKYVFLALFIFILPFWLVDEFGYGVTWFCRHICPAGTLEAGLPMLMLKPELRGLVSWLFYSKLAILILFLIWMAVSRRPFCRTACPLGAIYSLFNKHSVFRMVHHPDKCTRCQACYQGCPMGVKIFEGANQTECIRCLKCMQQSCKFDAISYDVSGFTTPQNAHLNSR